MATSTATRDDEVQVRRLVDGDLETGWNSLSGDLIGSWIAFRLPPQVGEAAVGQRRPLGGWGG